MKNEYKLSQGNWKQDNILKSNGVEIETYHLRAEIQDDTIKAEIRAVGDLQWGYFVWVNNMPTLASRAYKLETAMKEAKAEFKKQVDNIVRSL